MNDDRIQYSVLVISSSDKAAGYISDVLHEQSKTFFSPIVCCRSLSDASEHLKEREFGIIIINLPLNEGGGIDFAVKTVKACASGIMILIKDESYSAVCSAVEKYGIFTLTKPCTKQILYQSVRLLAASYERVKSIETKSKSLRAQIDEIKMVNRAKWLLIIKLSMSEEAAHHYIEKTAMDMRISRNEVAESIIKTYEN